MKSLVFYLPILCAVLGIVFMLFKAVWVKKQARGDASMQRISKNIKAGALAFLHAEYRLLLIFVVIAAAALFFVSTQVSSTHWMIVPAFVIGAFFSALAGNIGMRIATEANSRTAEAAKTSLPKALQISFNGGTVMGLGVAGLAVLGLSLLFLFFYQPIFRSYKQFLLRYDPSIRNPSRIFFGCRVYCLIRTSRRWYLYQSCRCRCRLGG